MRERKKNHQIYRIPSLFIPPLFYYPNTVTGFDLGFWTQSELFLESALKEIIKTPFHWQFNETHKKKNSEKIPQ